MKAPRVTIPCSFYSTFKNETTATPCHQPGQVEAEQSVETTARNNIDSLNTSNLQKQAIYCNDMEQQRVMTKSSMINEGKPTVCENNVGKNSLEKNRSNSLSSCTFREKKGFKRKRGWVVENFSEWVFPPGTTNKHGFVVSSLRQGIDPNISCENQDKPKATSSASTSISVRKNKTKVNKKTKLKRNDHETMLAQSPSKTMIHPTVKGAEFDSRFLKYEQYPDGGKKEDFLVRSLSVSTIPIKNYSQAKEAWEKNYIEEIPDEPSRSKTSSRIGPKYQARIPTKLPDGASVDTLNRSIPVYDTIWDPNLAAQAERRGEDIYGFLEGEHELCKQELLLSTLHKNNYRVEAAQKGLERMRRLNGVCASSKLNDHESRQFETLINQDQKDFSRIAQALKRSRSDCLAHYYKWKASNRNYGQMKKKWKHMYCSVCGDGGDLIICDGCNSNFHLECATPPLSAVPDGDWFCHCCRHTKRRVLSPLSPICTGKKSFSPTGKSNAGDHKSDSKGFSEKMTLGVRVLRLR